MWRASLTSVIRSCRNGLARLGRSSVIHSRYYRRHPLEIVHLIQSRRRLRSAAVSQPRDLLARLGIPERPLDDFERWRETLAPVVAGKSRVGISDAEGRILYAAVRALRPAHVIETGVAEGVSTSYIGAALVDNGCGILHSLELPPDRMPDDRALEDGSVYSWQRKGVAFLVPDEFDPFLAPAGTSAWATSARRCRSCWPSCHRSASSSTTTCTCRPTCCGNTSCSGHGCRREGSSCRTTRMPAGSRSPSATSPNPTAW